MSSVRLRIVVLATALGAVLGAAWPARAGAQLVEAYKRRLGAAYHADSARMRADSNEATRLRRLQGDTVRSGIVTIVGVGQLGPLARAVAGVTDSMLRRRLITAADVRPGARVFRLRPDSVFPARVDAGSVDLRPRFAIYLDITRGTKTETSAGVWSVGAPATSVAGALQKPKFVVAIANTIVSDLALLAQQQLPTAFLHWLDAMPADTANPVFWRETYLHLATSANLTARRCLVGDLEGCRLALRLGSTADPLKDWFTPDTRRAMVATLSSHDRSTRNGPVDDDHRCVDERNDDVCLAILRRDIPDAADQPIRGRYGQLALTVTALGTPGAPGYAAIRGHPGLGATVSLEAIAGVPLHDILVRWRTRVLAARTDTVVLEPRELLASAGWVLLLGLASLKGTRWR